jgi:hypothetical protein
MGSKNLVSPGAEYPKYLCSTYQRSGINNPHGCGCHGVHQDQLVEVLVRKLQQTVLGGDNLARLKKSLRQQIERHSKATPKGTNDLRRQLAELDREIDHGAENFLRAPADLLDIVGAKLTAMKRQRTHVQEELRRLEAASKPG